jgi:multidrug transporter EmrE-like cation transporter
MGVLVGGEAFTVKGTLGLLMTVGGIVLLTIG